jgi:hypothetical protein
MPGYNSQRLGTASTLPNLFVLFLFVIRAVWLLIVMFCVLFMCKCVLPPGVHPIAVDISIFLPSDSVTRGCRNTPPPPYPSYAPTVVCLLFKAFTVSKCTETRVRFPDGIIGVFH